MAEGTRRLISLLAVSLLAICSVVSTNDIFPRTVNVSPNVARVSGGIVAVVTGVNLNHSSTLMQFAFNDSNYIYKCQILQVISATEVQILIPKYTGDTFTSKTFRIQVILGGTWSSNDTAEFSYRQDPVVFDVTPKYSILAGGTTFTVTGVNFDSASKIVLDEMITSSGVPPKDYSTESYSHNSTCAKFRTPTISYAGNNTVSAFGSKGSISSIQMLLGISFDGVAYNFSSSVIVFPNPSILPWSPSEVTFVANQNNEITIDAIWPAVNFSDDDLIVRVGRTSCSDLRKINGTLLCRPPFLSPNIIRFGPFALTTPSVVVSVGNADYFVGTLLYTSEEPFHVIMIVMLSILAFIFLVAFLFGCIALCCPSNKSVGRKTKTNGVEGQGATLAYHPVGDDFGSSDHGLRVKGRNDSYDVIALDYRLISEEANGNEVLDGERDRFRKLEDDPGPFKNV